MKPRSVRFSPEDISTLRGQFEKLEEISSFADDIELSSKVASYGITREIGTVNDELARFIFDVGTAAPVRLESLAAEMVQWNGLYGVRIISTDSQTLELRTKGFYDVVHPGLSRNEDGTLHSLFIFPAIIEKIARNEGIQLVIVKSWGLNSIFGGFDPAKGYYQTNFWEIENNDVLKFSDLVRQGKLAFMGTHDLIAHIAGLDRNEWPLLKEKAQQVFEHVETYFESVSNPSISSLILPYTVGVVLDDLAQPPSYGSKSHIAVLNELLCRIAKNEVPVHRPTVLTEFPSSFQNIIDLSRTEVSDQNLLEIEVVVDNLVREILQSSLALPA